MTDKNDPKRKKRSDIKPEFIISPVPQLPEKKISEKQEIQLNIIAHTNFNFFNGKKLAQWLRENHKMWRAVLLPLDPLSLRDLAEGYWHADTLYIYPEDGWQFKLEEIMKEQFGADETRWIGGESSANMLGYSEIDGSYVILEAWWD